MVYEVYSKHSEENLVKKVCDNLNINQKQLAEKIGFSVNSVYQWNSGREIPNKAIKMLNLMIEYQKLKEEYENFRKKVLSNN